MLVARRRTNSTERSRDYAGCSVAVQALDGLRLRLFGIAEERRSVALEGTAVLVANGDPLPFGKMGSELVGGFTVTPTCVGIPNQLSRDGPARRKSNSTVAT
jgi:hypothetical protein